MKNVESEILMMLSNPLVLEPKDGSSKPSKSSKKSSNNSFGAKKIISKKKETNSISSKH